jgi:hypothetical protein
LCSHCKMNLICPGSAVKKKKAWRLFYRYGLKNLRRILFIVLSKGR